MRAALPLVLIAVSAISACSKTQDSTPFANVNGGDPARGDDNSSKDSGTALVDAGNLSDADAGGDAGNTMLPAVSCERVAAMPALDGDAPSATAVEAPADFSVTRQGLYWDGTCEQPNLTVQLSDGNCPNGNGHELDITFSLNDIQDGAVHGGDNDIVADVDARGIKVRYTRPKRLSPTGTWGTCGSVTGILIFLEAPDITSGSELQAHYQFTLAPCDGTDNANFDVAGEFKVLLRHSLNELCPTTTASAM
jgi:hypothetical protein